MNRRPRLPSRSEWPIDRPRYVSLADVPGVEAMQAAFRDWSFAPHSHPYFVVGVTVDGVGSLRRERAHALAPPGTVVLVGPGETHTGAPAQGTVQRYCAFYASPEQMASLVRQTLGADVRTVTFPSAVVEDRELAARLVEAHSVLAESSDGLRRESVVQDALALVVERHAAVKRQPIETPRAAAKVLREWLDAHLADEPTLRGLARAAGLEPLQALRTFRRAFGLPPHRYVLQQRVERAKRLLRDGAAVASAALESGFYDQSHFTRVFKRFLGVTPRRFQEQACRRA